MKLLNAAAVGVLVLAGAMVLWPMLKAAPGAGEAPDATVAVRVDTGASFEPAAAPPDAPVVATPATEPVAAPAVTRAYTVASAADRGQAVVEPTPQTFVGPDGRTHVIGAASPELLAMGDENLRAAVMDEIRTDPEAFALAMRVELSEVRRVAEGKAELPSSWITQ